MLEKCCEDYRQILRSKLETPPVHVESNLDWLEKKNKKQKTKKQSNKWK